LLSPASCDNIKPEPPPEREIPLLEPELTLRYGMNPHQTPARAFVENGTLPFEVRNGSPGYINLLDALNSWQLVRELKAATNLPAAASFKHVSPAGAAVGVPLSEVLAKTYFVTDVELSPLATAYARARGADRVSSFGDWVAVSDVVDEPTARLIRREVSDGIIAPGFTDEAVELLTKKQSGRYCMLEVDPTYTPNPVDHRTVFGVTLEQGRNEVESGGDQISNVVTNDKMLPESARRDLSVALTVLKYTQSNSMCMVLAGQVIGSGAGQQSRIHCTRLAGNKADLWYLRQHPMTLDLKFREGLGRPERDNAIDGFLRDDLAPAEDEVWRGSFAEVPDRLTLVQKREWLDGLANVAMGSDAFIPFRDNIDRAAMSGVKYIVQPGGSVRDEDTVAACDQYGMVMALSGTRLFHH
jgi:phosphoribosylaminoimidazolecarboxamide formyltransferase/IMP cyclohydrolase